MDRELAKMLDKNLQDGSAKLVVAGKLLDRGDTQTKSHDIGVKDAKGAEKLDSKDLASEDSEGQDHQFAEKLSTKRRDEFLHKEVRVSRMFTAMFVCTNKSLVPLCILTIIKHRNASYNL